MSGNFRLIPYRGLLYLIFFALALTATAGARAHAAVYDAFEWWQPVYMDFPVVKRDIRGYLESNSRVRLSEPSGANQYLLRAALGYRLRPNIEFFQGYAWINTWIPRYVGEQRSYQQLGIGQVVGKKYSMLYRMRNEQRFIQHRDGVSNRMRFLIRCARPLGNTRYYLIAYDELFINLNSVEPGPKGGFDQNRIYCGLGRQINNHMRAEIGYQWQYVNQPAGTIDVSAHILMTQCYIHF